jgi:hypothetical protein
MIDVEQRAIKVKQKNTGHENALQIASGDGLGPSCYGGKME